MPEEQDEDPPVRKRGRRQGEQNQGEHAAPSNGQVQDTSASPATNSGGSSSRNCDGSRDCDGSSDRSDHGGSSTCLLARSPASSAAASPDQEDAAAESPCVPAAKESTNTLKNSQEPQATSNRPLPKLATQAKTAKSLETEMLTPETLTPEVLTPRRNARSSKRDSKRTLSPDRKTQLKKKKNR